MHRVHVSSAAPRITRQYRFHKDQSCDSGSCLLATAPEASQSAEIRHFNFDPTWYATEPFCALSGPVETGSGNPYNMIKSFTPLDEHSSYM